MTEYGEYQKRLESILGTRIDMKIDKTGVSIDCKISLGDDPRTSSGARSLITHIRQQQKELRLLKKELAIVMKEVRSGYKAMKFDVQAGFFATLAGKKAAGQDRAYKREQLRHQELDVLRPYTALTQLIDQALLKLDSRKLELERIGMYAEGT